MTFSIGHVTGGTNAGWRRAEESCKEPWKCPCGHENKPNHRNCWECFAPRPKP